MPAISKDEQLPDGTLLKQFKFSTGTSADEKKLQITKFASTIEDLLKAGYFRAGITSLSLFDRVIGGLCWCITSSGVAVDVDILFRENMDIGQKVSLSEKVVVACREMKCPFPLQANQISQCNDFGALLPVIQFLCDAVIKWRALTGNVSRLYSEMEFSMKGFVLPEDDYSLNGDFMQQVQARYMANRFFKHPQGVWNNDDRAEEEARVQSCLLEYGEKFKRKKRSQDDEEKLNLLIGAAQKSAKNGGGRLAGFEKEYARMQRIAEKEEEERAKTMETREKELMQQMSSIKASNVKGARVGASEIGAIIRQQSDMIRSAAADLARVEAEIQEGAGMDASGAMTAKGMEQQFNRKVESLTAKIEKAKKKLQAVLSTAKGAEEAYQGTANTLNERQAYKAKLEQKLKEAEVIENKAEYQVHLAKLRELIRQNEALKLKESAFKANCKKQREKMMAEVERFKDDSNTGEDNAKLVEIGNMYDGVLRKYEKIRQLLAKKNQRIQLVGRQIDDVPTRTELIQYEKRFVELYQQVASKLEDNRKYYDYYNTQQRVLTFITKEADLLQSINDTFLPSMRSKQGKADFLQQLESIIKGILGTKASQEKVYGNIKVKHDAAGSKHQKLVEKQRAYFKALKDFQDACDKNEMLEEQIEAVGGDVED